MSTEPFAGKAALVTGAAGSIGNAVANRLAREGASLCLLDNQSCEATAEEARSEGAKVVAIEGDVTDPEVSRRAVSRALEAFGRLDIVVPVAGIASFGSAAALSREEWDRVLAVNLSGVFFTCQAAIEPMKRQGSGRIITIGSILGKNGGNARPWVSPDEQKGSGNVAYGVAKAGVHAMTLFLAKELASHGITVNCVAPGPVSTSMTATFPEKLAALIPVGRLGTAGEVAAAVCFLAGAEAGFISGEILDVNGGLFVD